MKTIVKILLLISLITLSGCMVVPARQGYSSYLEGSGGGYSSGVYITPPPVYVTPHYGYNQGFSFRGGWNNNRGWNNNWGWSNNRGWNNNRGWGGYNRGYRHGYRDGRRYDWR